MTFARPFVSVRCLLVLISTMAMGRAADFGSDIQPIFARHCYECHGPEKQKGQFRLDERSSALRAAEEPIIVPGKPQQSELYRRVTLPRGHEDIMPNRGEPLSKAQTDLIREWIASGAVWPDQVAPVKHWAYEKPVRPKLPETKKRHWVKNEVDPFILARLEKENLQPSGEAERARLLRRVYLDLIGLPPSPAEVQSFLADANPQAYEAVVNRLLNSPQYGERWARPWLDLARYADSSGFQRDNLWEIWPYRDWVIDALNRDMPFDQFTIEQLAGDLLPNATIEQKVATGFNRCAPINVEAGSDQEESRVNQVFDRVNTVGTVWLGSTIECAQCHNHKYDPFSQKEYYQLFAFFNNTPKESEFANPRTTIALEFAGPYLKLPDPGIEQRRAAIQEQMAKLNSQFDATSATLLSGEAEWEKRLASELTSVAQTHPLEIVKFETESGTAHELLGDRSALVRDDSNDAVPERDTYVITVSTKVEGITGFKLEALTDPSLPGEGPGRGDDQRPNFVLTDFKVTVVGSGQTNVQPIRFKRASASFEQKNFAVSKSIDAEAKTGWGIGPQFFKNHWAIFETDFPVGSNQGATLVFTLKQNYGGGRMIGRLRLSALTGTLTTNEIPAEVVAILQSPGTDRSEAQKERLKALYLDQQPQLQTIKSERAKLNAQLKNLQPPQTLAMQELEMPRMSATFVRGNFLEKGEPVQADVPAVLPPLGAGPRNRLGLARWLVTTNNPLTARVTVNRWWAEFFGQGLVRTPEDFGVKGDLPTHPELLDWLACEFMEHGWSMKHIHRTIVSSATYRQDSRSSAGLRARDGELYARGPRFRLEAEAIRDNALAIAGLLSLKMGGPPVYPYQPPGIWESKIGGNPVSYRVSEGEDGYRRGIYTVQKRTSPYPSFVSFDAPTRNTCTVRRPTSNTPLQALTLLNDPVFVEAAQALAKRVLKEKSQAPVEEKIRHAFQLCLARLPRENELKTLVRLYHEQRQASRVNSTDAEKLLRGSSPEGVDQAEFAAWFSVAAALLNLDETITKS